MVKFKKFKKKFGKKKFRSFKKKFKKRTFKKKAFKKAVKRVIWNTLETKIFQPLATGTFSLWNAVTDTTPATDDNGYLTGNFAIGID